MSLRNTSFQKRKIRYIQYHKEVTQKYPNLIPMIQHLVKQLTNNNEIDKKKSQELF